MLYQLEELGFCAKGEAKDFVKDGNIEIGGGLPVNTHGGQLGEAYLHGMNGIAEGVRQVRGSSYNQVPDVEHVLVTVRYRRPDQRAHPRRRPPALTSARHSSKFCPAGGELSPSYVTVSLPLCDLDALRLAFPR